jgi:hypothetical protein
MLCLADSKLALFMFFTSDGLHNVIEIMLLL